MLHQGVTNDRQRGACRGVTHGAEATIFPLMKEYQSVILRQTRHPRDDEEALTDLLNERSRSGWAPALIAQGAQRLTVVFQRVTDGEP